MIHALEAGRVRRESVLELKPGEAAIGPPFCQKFEELDKLYPYSEYSKKSLVNLAFLNYSRGKYTETVTAAKRFVTLYPGDELLIQRPTPSKTNR